ncbi:MAG: LemA family protein [Planctomycetes bacterium]|nr:LemA family protein [Planctomycetota bacterium]
MWIGGGIGGGLLLIAILWTIGTYNGLIGKREGVKSSWSDIDVQLKRRYDLIPNLVEVAKGYLKHEKELLEQVTAARAGALSALKAAEGMPTDALIAAENQLQGAMGRMNIAFEAYPDLKGNQNMMQLTEELTTTENKLAFARQYYNDTVQGYNVACQKFPAAIIAGMFGFKTAKFFEVDEAEREAIKEAPKVSF